MYDLNKNRKNLNFYLKITLFTAVKNSSILYGRVIAMISRPLKNNDKMDKGRVRKNEHKNFASLKFNFGS